MHNILFDVYIMTILMVEPIHFKRLTHDIENIFLRFCFTLVEERQSLERSKAKETHKIDI